MTEKPKAMVPKVRFRGFTDEWKQLKLHEITKRVKGNDGRMDLPTLTISASEGWMTQKKRFSSNIAGKEQKNYTLLQKGQLSYNHGNSKLAKYGVVYELRSYDEALVPKVYHSFSMLDNNIPFFVEKAFETKNLDRQLRRFVSSSARMDGLLNITFDNFMQVKMSLPHVNEQKKIAKLFSLIEQTINLHQRKADQLSTLKKALLQKMFADKEHRQPELRFKGFSGDWKQQKLGNLAKFINGRAYSQKELLDSGKYKVLRVGNFYTNDAWYYSNMELDEKYYANKGDLLYTWSASFGPHIWRGEKVIYHYHIWKLDLAEQLNKLFAVQLLIRDKNILKANTNGSTMAHITKKGMEEKIVQIPLTIKEQEVIGKFLEKLDQTIELHQHQLDQLQTLKKHLLQNMFI